MGERWHQGGFFLEALIASFSFATYVSTFPSPTSDNNKSVLPAPFPTFCPRKDGLARWRQKRLWIRRKVAETWKKRRSLKVGILHRLEKKHFRGRCKKIGFEVFLCEKNHLKDPEQLFAAFGWRKEKEEQQQGPTTNAIGGILKNGLFQSNIICSPRKAWMALNEKWLSSMLQRLSSSSHPFYFPPFGGKTSPVTNWVTDDFLFFSEGELQLKKLRLALTGCWSNFLKRNPNTVRTSTWVPTYG